jgi:hypothetical protein
MRIAIANAFHNGLLLSQLCKTNRFAAAPPDHAHHAAMKHVHTIQKKTAWHHPKCNPKKSSWNVQGEAPLGRRNRQAPDNSVMRDQKSNRNNFSA